MIIAISLCYADLNRPSNGQELRYIHILFEWDQEPDAVAYTLQASNQSSFNNIFLDVEETTTSYIDTENFTWNSNYYWRVRSIYSDGSNGNWIETSNFSTDDTQLTNLDVDIYNQDLIQDGVMMYSQFSPYFAVGVIDQLGNEIWNTSTGYMNHISDYGELYGVSEEGIKFNFDHEVLWQSPQGTPIDSHEVKQIPNGNFMAFVPTYQQGPIPIGDWTGLAQNFGYQADGVTNEFWWMGLRIVEFDKETSEEVWSWEPFEHFSMDDYDQYEGIWWQAIFDGVFDWMHTNAFHFDAEESVIYVSHRHLSRISKIAYPSGEVIWNMGLPAEYGTGDDNICTDLLFSFQHHIQLMDNGDLMFFDNGNLSDMLLGDSNPTTRIRRIRVIEDSYCETMWQYDLPQNLHGLGMGSVQLLENGNYFIYTFGNGLNDGECSVLEITSEGEMIWKATSQNQNAAWYRSYKIPSIHPSAFSVVADGYTVDGDNNIIIEMSSNSLDFTIYNKSGFTQPYLYQFSDLTDGGPGMFNYQEGEITLEPNENIDLSFLVTNTSISSTTIGLSVWPVHHSYALKEFILPVLPSNLLSGDINSDNEINVLDVVLLVNYILANEYEPSGDLNADGLLNVLDVVQLVNLILNN